MTVRATITLDGRSEESPNGIVIRTFSWERQVIVGGAERGRTYRIAPDIAWPLVRLESRSFSGLETATQATSGTVGRGSGTSLKVHVGRLTRAAPDHAVAAGELSCERSCRWL